MTYYTMELIKAPNQKFNVNIGENNFEFVLSTFRGILFVSVYINTELIQGSIVATPNKSLFSDAVNNKAGGRFEFIVPSNDYPNYNMFDGLSCVFAYIPSEA